MDTKKLENIIIFILLLLNMFLMGVVLRDMAEDSRSRRDTAEMLTTYLAQSGVAVSPEAVLVQECPPAYTVVRNMEQEHRRVQNLLGICASQDLGGGIWYYESDGGNAVLRGTGETEMHFAPGTLAVRQNVSALTRRFYRAGLELSGSDTGNENEVALSCAWNGIPVQNAKLTFHFTANGLSELDGTMVFQEGQVDETQTGMDAATALIRFGELVRSGDYACTQLEEINPVYTMNVTLSGESVLTPTWRIVTDSGELYLIAVT